MLNKFRLYTTLIFFTACASLSFAQRTILDVLRPTFDSSQVVQAVIDTLIQAPGQNVAMSPQIALPSAGGGYELDRTRIVGEVPYEISTSLAGQVELTIPIETFASQYESAPQIAVKYRSQDEMTCLGNGWSISGLSEIAPTNKIYFTDGNSSGKDKTHGPWALDGNRLIFQQGNDTVETFLTQTGNTKVNRSLTGNGNVFEACLPDGTVSTYTYDSENNNSYIWYLTKSTTLDGKEISYSYDVDGNLQLISRIDYGEGRSLSFYYIYVSNNRTSYLDGLEIRHNSKLARIEVAKDGHLLRKYLMTYRDGDITAPLSQVDMTDSTGNSVNPLRFHYYGDNANGSVSTSTKALQAHFNFSNSRYFIAQRGKIDCGGEDDALIIYPNKHNYYKKGYHRVIDLYDSDDEIVINYGLRNIFSDSYSVIKVGQGFVNAFCMDVDGAPGEEFVKVNQNLEQDMDHITFDIYKKNANDTLCKYTTIHRYLSPLVRSSHHSVWPTGFLAGDFTGNGREELIMCRSSSPLNHEEAATIKMLDLYNNTTLYSDSLDSYQLYIPGNEYSDTENEERAKNSDRLFATDLDGDGKLEMCILSNAGLDIYRFSYDSAGALVMDKSTSTAINLQAAHDYNLEVGDMNGDGNSDLVLLPIVENKGVRAYLSRGNGAFVQKTTPILSDAKTDFMCLDFNQDGQSDIMRYYKDEYINEVIDGEPTGRYSAIYMLENGLTSDTCYLLRYEPTIMIPVSVFGRSSNTIVMSIKANGNYQGHRCVYPKTMDALLTRVDDSRACSVAMEYVQLYENDNYTVNGVTSFPYERYTGGLFVCSAMSRTSGGNIESNRQYSYLNATIHRQGLGFCGFQSIMTTDLVRNESMTQSFNPECFGAPTAVSSPRESISYGYQSSVSEDKRIKLLLTQQDQTDLTTGVETTSSFTYDSYGNLLTQNTSRGGITKATTRTCQNVNDGSHWIIGAETRRSEEISRNGQSVTIGLTTRYNSNWLPDTVTEWRNAEQYAISTKIIKYDELLRPAVIKTRPYSGTKLKRFIDYQESSRKPKGISDEDGMYTYWTYGDFGVTTSSVKPELIVRIDDDSPITPVNPGGPTNSLNGLGGNSGIIRPVLVTPVTTAIHYDAWGRQDSVACTNGMVKTVCYSWADGECPEALYKAETTESGKPVARVWYDAFGKKVKSSVQNIDDRWSSVFYEYDDYGRLARQSVATFTASPSQWTTFSYDSFDRLIQKVYPDGHTDTYSYNGLLTTSTIDNVTSTRTVDAAGNLVEVNDGGGRIEYTLLPDGQPSAVCVDGSITTAFEYDLYGRRTAISDPSAGRRTTAYDENGHIASETDPRGVTVTSVYSANGMLASQTFGDDMTVIFGYDAWNAPVAMISSNGHNKNWTYNNQRQLVVEDIDGFKKTFSYDGNQLSSVSYSKNNDYICSENYSRNHGYLTSITLNTGDTIWSLRTQNARLLPAIIGTGSIQRGFSYDNAGHVTSRMAHNRDYNWIQRLSYSYNADTGNMSSRSNNNVGVNETFAYDGMNRLSGFSRYEQNTTLEEHEVLYDSKGNILSRSDAGQYAYSPCLPYGINQLASPATSVPMRGQQLHFNAMQQPDTIIENGYTATFCYHGDKSRASMVVTGPDAYALRCDYYDQQLNEYSKTAGGTTVHKSVLWLGGTPYNAFAALLKDYGQSDWQVVYVLRDNLGSITHVTDSAGNVIRQMDYTAWGLLRNPQDGTVYGPDEQPELLLGRGYTGHEHLPWFGLINMNARLYDPAVGRFLSPDPVVQTPDNTQNFNRYSYCMNNPLKYTDQDGQLFLFTIFNAITDLFGNVAEHGFNVSQYNWKRTKNSWKIDIGMFKGNFKQILNKWTYGGFVSFVGSLVSEIYNTLGIVDRVTDLDGMLALSGATGGNSAMTIGHYSLGPDNYVADWRDHLFVHEYGHYIQAQRMGSLYFPIVAIPSLLSAWKTSKWSGTQHGYRWFEVNASKLGAEYFDKHYGRDENGNRIHDENHFDYDNFISSINPSIYVNPRTGSTNQDHTYPVSGSKIVFWDFFL